MPLELLFELYKNWSHISLQYLMQRQYEKLYNQLRLFYQLIYYFDIEEYNLVDLKSLSSRLESQLNLQQKEKKIHDELISKSKRNVEKRLSEKHMNREMKKQKKVKGNSKMVQEVNETEKFKKRQEKIVEIRQQEGYDYINESCIIDYPKTGQVRYMEGKTIEGKIYQGKLYIKLNIANPQKNIQKDTYFEITSDVEDSSLNSETVKQLSLNANSPQASVIIEGRKTLVKLIDKQYNTIGFKYLRSNNVLTKCNFRADNSTFSMIFTQ